MKYERIVMFELKGNFPLRARLSENRISNLKSDTKTGS